MKSNKNIWLASLVVAMVFSIGQAGTVFAGASSISISSYNTTSPVTVSGAFTTASADDGNFTVVINWGDGSPTTAGIMTWTTGSPKKSGTWTGGPHSYATSGNYTISVALLKGGTPEAGGSSPSIPVTVIKINPVITWTSPADIFYGTALSATQLNAIADVLGTFTYTPAAGTVLSAGLSQILSAHFVPNDTANYYEADASTTINVNKATPVITWANPADITYGTALDATQLNATSTTPGTYTYNPIAGTILGVGLGQTLSVHFVPGDTTNYNDAYATTTINVTKEVPVITWTNPADITYGTVLDSTQLNATATVPGVFTYAPAAGTIPGAGLGQTLSVHFVPADTTNYAEADASTTINVSKIDPVIVWATPNSVTYPTVLGPIQLNATTSPVCPTCSAPGALIYSPDTGYSLPVGTSTLTVTSPATSDYNSTSTSVKIYVQDVTAPVIDAHADITGVEATSASGAVVTFTVNSTDDWDGILPANCSPISGSTFAIGTTTVTCNQTDSSGNIATSTSFKVEVVDTTAPAITVNGSDPVTLEVFGSYTDAGASSTDIVAGDLTSTIVTINPVNTSIVGKYTVIYTSTDTYGNTASSTRTVNIVDTQKPTITILGLNPVNVEAGTTYTDAGATSTDNYDGNLTSAIIPSSTVNTAATGTYAVTYTVTDSSGNSTSTERTVNVADTKAPILALVGSSTMIVKIGHTFTDPGTTASDSFDTSVSSSSVIVTGTVNTATTGTYPLLYSVADASGNTATTTRTVNVIPLSSNSALSALTVSQGTLSPSFASSTLSYAVLLPYGATITPTTTATLADSFATSTITNATNVTSATSSDRTTTIKVVAEDGIASTTYEIVFAVASAEAVTPPPVVVFFGGGGSHSGSFVIPAVLATNPLSTIVPVVFAEEPQGIVAGTSTENVSGAGATTTDQANLLSNENLDNLAAVGGAGVAFNWWIIIIILILIAAVLVYLYFVYRNKQE